MDIVEKYRLALLQLKEYSTNQLIIIEGKTLNIHDELDNLPNLVPIELYKEDYTEDGWRMVGGKINENSRTVFELVPQSVLIKFPLHNGDLRNSIEKIERWQDDSESFYGTPPEKLKIEKSFIEGDNLGNEDTWYLDVADESFFYANEMERNLDYTSLCEHLTSRSYQFTY